MKMNMFVNARFARLFVVIASFALYMYLLRYDAHLTFMRPDVISSMTQWLLQFGIAAVTGFVFLSSGSLVFIYLRRRLLASLFFIFCFSMMISFAVQTIDLVALFTLPTSISQLGAGSALYCFDVLLLLFPVNLLTRKERNVQRREGKVYFARLYLLLLTAAYLVFLSPIYMLSRYSTIIPASVDTFRRDIAFPLTAFFVVSSFVTIFVSSRRAITSRERQQARLLLVGMSLSYAPFVLGTVLPFSLSSLVLTVSSQFTTISFSLVPIAFCYAVLRYSLIIIDRHIRLTVTILVGTYMLVMGSFLIFCLSSIFVFSGRDTFIPLLAALSMCIILPTVWRLAPGVVKQIFAPELYEIHRLLYEQSVSLFPDREEGKLSVEQVAHLMRMTAAKALHVRQSCLFTLEKESGGFRLIESLAEISGHSELDKYALEHLGDVLSGATRTGKEPAWFDAHLAGFEQLAQTRRPVFLSELGNGSGQRRMGRGYQRWFTTTQANEDPLLVPIRKNFARSELIGILVLGARDDSMQYAGSDFAILDVLLIRMSWLLEMALADAQTQQHVSMLRTLYSASTTSNKQSKELMHAYVNAAAASIGTGACAEIYLYESHNGLLRRAVSAGDGPLLTLEGVLRPREKSDWSPTFYEGGVSWKGETKNPQLSILETPEYPFAWLPLLSQTHRLGVLVLTYPSVYHAFSAAEKQVLEFFSLQLVTELVTELVKDERYTESISYSTQVQEQDRALVLFLRALMAFLPTIQTRLNQLSKVGILYETQQPILQTEQLIDRVRLLPENQQTIRFFFATLQNGLSRLNSLVLQHIDIEQSLARTFSTRVRAEINEILQKSENPPVVLIVTRDSDMNVLLTFALHLSGYSSDDVVTCEQAIQLVERQWQHGVLPSAIILDEHALGAYSRADFMQQLQSVWRPGLPLAPVFLLDDDTGVKHQGHKQEDSSPFSFKKLLTKVREAVPIVDKTV